MITILQQKGWISQYILFFIALAFYSMKLTIPRVIALFAAAVIPTMMVANKANAMCRCKSVFKQGYGMVWLCCDSNGICGYYDSYQSSC
jgi:hypothetical protein